MYNVTASEELEVRVSRLQERLERAEQVTKKWQAADMRPKESVQITDSSKSVCGMKRVQVKLKIGEILKYENFDFSEIYWRKRFFENYNFFLHNKLFF